MDDSLSYPPIEPSNFDLIIVGTGLPESVLAAAAAAVGKTVLHLDPNSFYGSHFSSLSLDELTSFLQFQSSHHSPPPAVPSDGDCIAVNLTTCPMYSDVEISSPSPEPLQHSRKFNLDLAGPRALFCADSVVDLLLKSGASQYIEFKNVDASFVGDGAGMLSSVPDSRSAIFGDKSIVFPYNHRLLRFFKLVEGHLKAVSDDGSEQNARISEEDLDSPFVEFLNKMQLSAKIKSSILYAITMADYDQDNIEVCKDPLKTKDGINRLALYHSSVGRFPNARGALIYPIYGQGELPQAFCRRAAVKGCLYVLRMPVDALLRDKDSGSFKGVKVASGQELFCHQIVLGPSFTVSSPFVKSSTDFLLPRLKDLGLRDVRGKVARGICITEKSLKPDMSTVLVVYPPKSLFPEQVTSIRVLQIGSNSAVCPLGMFVLYVSALCEDAIQGKKTLHAALDALFSVPVSAKSGNCSTDESEKAEVEPTLLWTALFIQEITTWSFESITSTPMPDGNLDYSFLLNATEELFHRMFPDEEFFPETAFSDPEDGVLDQSSNNDLVGS